MYNIEKLLAAASELELEIEVGSEQPGFYLTDDINDQLSIFTFEEIEEITDNIFKTSKDLDLMPKFKSGLTLDIQHKSLNIDMKHEKRHFLLNFSGKTIDINQEPIKSIGIKTNQEFNSPDNSKAA